MSKDKGQDNQTEKLFENKKWLSVTEASSRFGISRSMLHKHRIYGIPCSTTTGRPGGKLKFREDDLDQWLGERKIS